MKMKALLTFIIMFSSQFSYSQKLPCNSFIGKWITPDNDIVEIYKSNDMFMGKLVSLGSPLDENGKPWKDKLNPDKTLQNREVKGIVILKNLRCDKDGKLVNGKVYLPEEGEELSCSLRILNEKQIEIKVTVGIFSDTETWTKLKGNE
jgi:uncharacterized protein (DUF2147 family)